jgi:hypothetical protein
MLNVCASPINKHFSLRAVRLNYLIWSWFPWWQGGHHELQYTDVWPTRTSSSRLSLFLFTIFSSSWDTYTGHNNLTIKWYGKFSMTYTAKCCTVAYLNHLSATVVPYTGRYINTNKCILDKENHYSNILSSDILWQLPSSLPTSLYKYQASHLLAADVSAFWYWINVPFLLHKINNVQVTELISSCVLLIFHILVLHW